MARGHDKVSLDLLAGLGNLRLRCEYLLDGALAGMHRSPFQGFSAEFDQYRGYSPGDDPRFFDWRVFGRTGHAVVKRYRDETNASLYLIVDTSASMGYAGGGALSKLEVATLFAGALASLGYRARDGLSLMTGAGGLEGVLPPRTGGAHYHELLNRLDTLRPAGVTDIATLLAAASRHLKSRSMAFIFTDLWQEPETLRQGLQQVRARHQAVCVAHLTTTAEQDLAGGGEMLYRDLETGATLRLAPEAFRADYVKARVAHQDTMRALCHDLGAHMLTLDIAAPLDASLRALVRDFALRMGAT
jgi:uncharacterized protein (DUF58 family)